MPRRRTSGPARCDRGFTYIGLLFAIAAIGLLLAAAGQVWKVTAQRQREEQLLFAGRDIARAIADYRAASPAEPKTGPRRLEDLVEDRRFQVTRRHLRRVWVDPMTNRPEWGLIKSGEFIVGVHSLGEGKPLKVTNFRPEEDFFAAAASHSDWHFLAGAAAANQSQ